MALVCNLDCSEFSASLNGNMLSLAGSSCRPQLPGDQVVSGWVPQKQPWSEVSSGSYQETMQENTGDRMGSSGKETKQ